MGSLRSWCENDHALLMASWARAPNKRLKLPGPAFSGSRRLCANQLVPQDGVLAPARARPAA